MDLHIRQISIACRAGVTALGLMLAGCAVAPGPVVAVRPSPAPIVNPLPAAATESPASAAARANYAQIQQALLSQGLMRTDTAPTDAPFTDRMLAENFLRIALYDEYDRRLGGTVRSEAPTQLQRWRGPVRVGLRFGASVPTARVAIDTARVSSYLARLARITGHPIYLDDAAPNFIVEIASVDERRALGPALTASLSQLTPAQIASITNMDVSTFCLVYAQSDGAGQSYARAFAVIPAEQPDLLRLSCIHEEIAQGLGLTNDSGAARPSIFNDDEEFALLTNQDELMLRILYDPALRPGMTEVEARPVVFSLAARLVGGGG